MKIEKDEITIRDFIYPCYVMMISWIRQNQEKGIVVQSIGVPRSRMLCWNCFPKHGLSALEAGGPMSE